MKRLPLTAALLLLLVSGNACKAEPPKAPTKPLPVRTVEFVDPATKAVASIRAEVATSINDMEYGLMNRKSLPERTGMLFIFPATDEVSFWMKDTLIPLDMLFIGSNGRVNHIHANAKPKDETSIPSQGPVKAVLEITGGESAKLGLHEGDMIRIVPVAQDKTPAK